MLKQLSRLERTRNFVIIGFVVLMAVSLVVFYAPGRSPSALEPASSTETLAKVGGDEVTVGDLTRIRESYKQRFSGQISLAQLGLNDQRFLDGLIRDRVIAQEAARQNLGASEAEVAEEIRRQFTDASGKFMGEDDQTKAMERYRDVVTSNYGGVDRFEQQISDGIAAQKLQAFVTAGARVSDEEVQDDYKRKNTSFDLVYVPVLADKLAGKLQLSEQDERAYYDQHKDDYKINTVQKKIRYLYIDQAKVGEKLQISDADLQAEYDKLSPENKRAGAKVQQIVLRIAHPDLDATVKAKATELVTKARGTGGSATEEAFADIAKGNSEDPATAKNGGAVAGVVKKSAAKKDDPYQKVVDLPPGSVSDPIKFNNAYYIIRRGEDVPKTFADAKQELLVSLRNRKAYGVAAPLASKAAQRLKEVKDVAKVAAELAKDANMSAGEMVRETPSFVKPGDDVPNIGSSPQFEGAIAPLNNVNDVGDSTQVKGGFAVPMLVDKKDPRTPDFEEVREQVSKAVKLERAKSQIEQAAQDLAKNAGAAADLKAAAEKLGLEAQTSDAYKLGSSLGTAGTSPALDDAIYNLKAGEVTKTALKVGENWVVVGATKRTEADLAEFAKTRDELTKTALQTRRDQVFNDYIAGVQNKMKQDGKIKIYQEVLDSIAEEEAPPVAAPPRGRPQPIQIPTGK